MTCIIYFKKIMNLISQDILQNLMIKSIFLEIIKSVVGLSLISYLKTITCEKNILKVF